MSINQYHCQCSCLISDKWSGGAPCHKQEWYASRVNTKRQIWLGRVNQNVSPHWTLELDTGHCTGHWILHLTLNTGHIVVDALHLQLCTTCHLSSHATTPLDSWFGNIARIFKPLPKTDCELAWWKESQSFSQILSAHIQYLKKSSGIALLDKLLINWRQFEMFPEKLVKGKPAGLRSAGT